MFSLLTVDVGFYLPSYKTINVYFMKDIMAKRKKAIKNADLCYLYAPQYEELTSAKIIAFAMERGGVVDYLPAEKDIPALPRQVSYNQLDRRLPYSLNINHILYIVDHQRLQHCDRSTFLGLCAMSRRFS